MAWTLINSAQAGAASNPTTPGITCTGADLIVACVDSFAAGTGFSDSSSNTWQQIGSFASGNAKFVSLYYKFAPATSASQTFKVSGTSVFAGITVTAWSGSIGSGLVDQTNHAIGAAVTTLAAGSITPTNSNSLVIMGLGTDAGTAQSISSGTIQQNIAFVTNVNEGSAIAYFVQSAPAAFNPSWSWTTAANGVAIIASFPPLPPPPASTVAAFNTATRAWQVTITGVLNGLSSAVFSGKGYQTGTYETSGTLGVGGSAQWRGSNDGVTFVPVGPPVTALPSSGILAAPAKGVFALYRLDVTAGDGTTSFNAVVNFTSSNAA